MSLGAKIDSVLALYRSCTPTDTSGARRGGLERSAFQEHLDRGEHHLRPFEVRAGPGSHLIPSFCLISST